MPSSAKISFTSPPFYHFTTSTSPSRLSNNETSLRKPKEISHLIADLVGPASLRTFQKIFKVAQLAGKEAEKKSFQVGLHKNLQEEMSESFNFWNIVQELLQIDNNTRGQRNESKLKINLPIKVFGLIIHKTIQSILVHECDFLARVFLNFNTEMSQNELYTIHAFFMKACLLFNISFQSKDHSKISELFNFLYKMPILQEEQIWRSYTSLQLSDEPKDFMVLKSSIEKDRQVFDQHKFKDSPYFDDNLADDKCSTASRSSINTHERNFEINDLDSGNNLESSLNLRFCEIQSPPRSSRLHQNSYSQFFECSVYDGCFVGDLDIMFTPTDKFLTHFDEVPSSTPSKKKANRPQNNLKLKTNASNQTKPFKEKMLSKLQTAYQGEQAASNHQKIELKLFTLPNFAFDPRYCAGLSAAPEQNYQNNMSNKKGQKSSVVNGNNGSNEITKKKISQSKNKDEKAKAKKAPQDKSIKLWDMISVNGKLKKN